jgi:Uroporphyrinogen decarboxylase (URO-D)
MVWLLARRETNGASCPVEMPESTTTRQILKGLLQGIAPSRPLFLPIVFSHGARIENLSLRAFLTNPTKISNSLRQIRARLRSDGVTCYFDPLLEAEALGGTIDWDAGGQVRSLRWAGESGELHQGERLLEEPAKRGRIGVALEVIRRLKLILRDDCLLMVGIAGPFALAKMLAQLNGEQNSRADDISEAFLDLAASLITPLAASMVEAGASVIFIREEALPVLSEEACAGWAARVAAAVNVIRFYEALPVLLLTDGQSVGLNREAIVHQNWDCVVCPALDATGPDAVEGFRNLGPARFGIALPPDVFKTIAGATNLDQFYRRLFRDSAPALVTTAGEVPAEANMEGLNKLWETIRR